MEQNIAGIVIGLCCSLGCGGLFYGIGLWSCSSLKPVNFWAGTTIDSSSISDVTGYNRANGTMWKIYSIPYWLAGVFCLLSLWQQWFMILYLVCLGAACFIGLPVLIHCYRRIEKKYRVKS